jgi:molybdate transport system ATP-binding protein
MTVAPALEAEFQIRVAGDGEPFQVDVKLHLERGLLVLFGPSGSGKSLSLQVLAGLRAPHAGYMRLRGDTLFDIERGVNVPAHQRGIGYIPQQQNLFPFCNVTQNVCFGLPAAERRPDNQAVLRLMEELGLTHLARARPSQLSGGERQRVALARALAVRPRALLLDEAFASIDSAGRKQLQQLLKAVLDEHKIPAVFVTHDAEEAIALGDSMVRFEHGRTLETGAPSMLIGSLLRQGIAGGGSQPC